MYHFLNAAALLEAPNLLHMNYYKWPLITKKNPNKPKPKCTTVSVKQGRWRQSQFSQRYLQYTWPRFQSRSSGDSKQWAQISKLHRNCTTWFAQSYGEDCTWLVCNLQADEDDGVYGGISMKVLDAEPWVEMTRSLMLHATYLGSGKIK